MAERKDIRKMTVQELKEHRKSLEDKEIIGLLTDSFTMLELRDLFYKLSAKLKHPGDREKLTKSTKIELAKKIMKLGRYNAKSPFIKELKEKAKLNRRNPSVSKPVSPKPTSPRKEVERKSSKKASSPRPTSPRRESKKVASPRPASPRRTSSKKA